jgi:hypothetical protein
MCLAYTWFIKIDTHTNLYLQLHCSADSYSLTQSNQDQKWSSSNMLKSFPYFTLCPWVAITFLLVNSVRTRKALVPITSTGHYVHTFRLSSPVRTLDLFPVTFSFVYCHHSGLDIWSLGRRNAAANWIQYFKSWILNILLDLPTDFIKKQLRCETYFAEILIKISCQVNVLIYWLTEYTGNLKN